MLLAGHSYGGAVITVAGVAENVVGLVYVAAYALEEGESLGALQGGFPDSALAEHLVYAPYPIEGAEPGTDVSVAIDAFPAVFAGGLDPDEAKVLAVSQRPLSAVAFGEPASVAAWRTKPAWGIVSSADRTINPDVERFGYQRAGLRSVVEVDATAPGDAHASRGGRRRHRDRPRRPRLSATRHHRPPPTPPTPPTPRNPQGERHGLRDHRRRCRDLLQGLGRPRRPADRVPPRLAAVLGRLGRADALLPGRGLPRRRLGPPRARPVVADRHRSRHGPLRAADVSAVVEHLDLRNAIHIGHSTGGGQVARYVAKYGQPQGRVAKAVLVAAVPPLMLKTDANPEGTDISVFDGFRAALAANRAEFFHAVASGPFYGFNRDGVTPSEPVIANWWRQGMTGSAVAHLEGIKAFSETDQTEDLRAITVPVLVLQGDDDQVVRTVQRPSSRRSSSRMPRSRSTRATRTACSRRTRTSSTRTSSPSSAADATDAADAAERTGGTVPVSRSAHPHRASSPSTRPRRGSRRRGSSSLRRRAAGCAASPPGTAAARARPSHPTTRSAAR